MTDEDLDRRRFAFVAARALPKAEPVADIAPDFAIDVTKLYTPPR